MESPKKTFAYLFVSAIVLIALIGVAKAATVQLSIKGGEETNYQIKLADEDRVLIRFNVIGVESKTIHFSFTFPNATVADFGDVGSLSHSFVCDAEGEYTLHFNNTASSETKLVTMDYEIDHYILGIPQMLFLVLLIAVICVLMVASFILMGRHY